MNKLNLKCKRDELISIHLHHSYLLSPASATLSNSKPYRIYSSREWKVSNWMSNAKSPKQGNLVAQSRYDYHKNHAS